MIGILGAGQLGRMLALSGYPLGLDFRFFEAAEETCVEPIAQVVKGDFNDEDALARFADGLSVVTYEFENVPVQAAHFLSTRVPVYPPPLALETAQDRLSEKTLFERLKIPTPPFAPVDSLADLESAVERIGLPAVLKTRRMGYDGKGQFVLRQPDDLGIVWKAIGSVPLILEGFVPFEREASILALRNRSGATAFYPLVENYHDGGILRRSLAPTPRMNASLERQAEDYARRVLAELDYVGILAIEFFVVDGRLLANEMAPRVHNSGHWTMDGAETSQFENHLRAVLDLPLGSTQPRGYCAMLNLIGNVPPIEEILAIPESRPHLYGKTPRSGRKLGHINVCAASPEERVDLLARVEPLVAAAWTR